MPESTTLPKPHHPFMYDPRDKVKPLVFDEDFDIITLTAKKTGILYTEKNPLPDPQIDMVWKRPKEFCKKPYFIDGTPSRFDALQGTMGDCWLVSAIEALTLNEHVFDRVVPRDQSFEDNYTGAFHFRFWNLGKWYDVVVDDRLPIFISSQKECFVHSRKRNVFWAALLEKAYSKMCNRQHTDYKSLSFGESVSAFQDFTGGIVEKVDPKKPPPGRPFKWFLNEVISNKALATCNINADHTEEELKQISKTKLIVGHAYLVVDVFYKKDDDPDYHGLCLIKLMNTLGQKEWTGEWNDNDFDKWKQIDRDTKNRMGFNIKNDGEFWMCEEDFKQYFTTLQVCHLDVGRYFHSHFGYNVQPAWSTTTFAGEWIKGVSAGGSNKDKLHINPQYKIQLTTPDDDADGLVAVVIELTQKSPLKIGSFFIVLGCGIPESNIGFYIYLINNEKDKNSDLGQDFFDKHTILNDLVFPTTPQRNYVTSLYLLPGWYCIVPFIRN